MSLRRKDSAQHKHVLAPACAPPNPRPVARLPSFTTGAGYEPSPLSPAYSRRREVSRPRNVSVVDAVFRQMGLETERGGRGRVDDGPGDLPPSKSTKTTTDAPFGEVDVALAEPGSSLIHPILWPGPSPPPDVWFVSDLEGGTRTVPLLEWISDHKVKGVHLGDSGDIGPTSTTVIKKLNEMKDNGTMQLLAGNRDWNWARVDEIFYTLDDGKFTIPPILIKRVGPGELYSTFHTHIKTYVQSLQSATPEIENKVQLMTVILFCAMNSMTRGTERAYWDGAKKKGEDRLGTFTLPSYVDAWRSLSTSPDEKLGCTLLWDQIQDYISKWSSSHSDRPSLDTLTHNIWQLCGHEGVQAMYYACVKWKEALHSYVDKSNVLYYNDALGVLGVHDWFGEDAELFTERRNLALFGLGTFNAYSTSDFNNKDPNEIRWAPNEILSDEMGGMSVKNWCGLVNDRAKIIVQTADGRRGKLQQDQYRRYMADIADIPSKSFMHGERPANYLNTIVDKTLVSGLKELPNFIMLGHQPTLVGRMGSKSYTDASKKARRCTLVEIDTQFTPFCRSVARVFSKTTPSVHVDRDTTIDELVTRNLNHAVANLFPAGHYTPAGKLKKGAAAWSLGLVEDEFGKTYGVVGMTSNFVNRLITYEVDASKKRGHHKVDEVCVLGSLCFLRKSTDTKGPPLGGMEVYESLTPGADISAAVVEQLDPHWRLLVTPFMDGLKVGQSTGTFKPINIADGSYFALTSYSHSCDMGVQNHALTPPVA